MIGGSAAHLYAHQRVGYMQGVGLAASTAWQAAWSRHVLLMQARALNVHPVPFGQVQQIEGQFCGELQLPPAADPSSFPE